MQIDDFTSFSRKKMENTKINDTSFSYSLVFYGNKFIFLLQRVLLPILFFKQSILTTLFMFAVCELVAGFLFGYFSQITHVQEDVLWPNTFEIEQDWGELQVQTAVDYCQDSYFWTYISGNLNYQVIHHLFPSVAPHKYSDLNYLVLEKIKKYNLKYTVMSDISSVLDGHFDHLSQFQKYRNKKKIVRTGKERFFLFVRFIVKFFQWR